VVLIGGSNFVAVRFSNAELPPYWGAALRFFPASLLLLAAMAAWRIPFPHGASLRGAAIYGALNFGLGYALGYYGLQDAPAGTGAVVLATVPLFTLLLVALHGQERFRVRGLVGGIIALAGIAIVFREQLSASVPLLSLLAMLGNALVAAEAGVIAKGMPRMHPIATNAVGMLVGAIFLLALSFAVGEAHDLPHTATTWAVVAYLSIIGSIGLFGLFLVMLRRWTASASSYALVVMPLVAVSLGALLRGETISPIFLVGAALVAAGVYVGALSGAVTRGSRAVPDPIRSASSR
jgi:drug/metabolite transporter (DMT)-like permease